MLERFFLDAPQLCRDGTLGDLNAFKMAPLDDPLELGGEKKITRSKIRRIRMLFKYSDVLLGQELPDAQGVVSTCIVVVKQPRFILPCEKK